MSGRTLSTPITPEEWRLLCRLRDIPPGRSRDQLLGLMDELTRFAAAPGCSEMQADGVPCATVHAACEDCQRVAACLAQLRLLVGTPEAGGLA